MNKYLRPFSRRKRSAASPNHPKNARFPCAGKAGHPVSGAWLFRYWRAPTAERGRKQKLRKTRLSELFLTEPGNVYFEKAGRRVQTSDADALWRLRTSRSGAGAFLTYKSLRPPQRNPFRRFC